MDELDDTVRDVRRGALCTDGLNTCLFHQGRPCRVRNSSKPLQSLVATTHSPVKSFKDFSGGAAILLSVTVVS
jgi:hypothetical protein